jgi:hypothetical protein
MLDAPAKGNAQEDLSVLDLKPGVGATTGQGLQDRNIVGV